MRQDRRAMAVGIAGLIALAGTIATAQFLDAADLQLLPKPRPGLQAQQQVEPPQPEQAPPQPAPQPAPQATTESPGSPQPVPPAAQPGSGNPDRPATVTLDRQDARGVLGREVRSAADENMGRIIDVIVDRAGNARAAIIDFGGFLGVGSRKIAVDWNALHFAVADGKDRITLEFTRDQVKAAPDYQEGKPIIVLGASDTADWFRVTTSVRSEK